MLSSEFVLLAQEERGTFPSVPLFAAGEDRVDKVVEGIRDFIHISACICVYYQSI